MKISTILFFCLLMTACMQTKSFHRINGWYYVTSQTTDSLSLTPFLTVKDFDTLRLETDAFGHSVITGWKSHATLTLLATQDLPTFGYNMIDPLKSWCWGSILFYPFKISRFS